MSMPVTNEEPMLHPTIFIGLGEIGVLFLAQIQQRMPVSFETSTASLGICVGGEKATRVYSSSNPFGFDINSVINLPWDHDQAHRLAEKSPGLGWWMDGVEAEKARPRLDSRMAFVMAVHFQHDVRLQNRLSAAIKSLQVNETNPVIIYLVASLHDPESAFIGDLASEIYSLIGRKSVRALLPCLMLNTTRKGAPDRDSWTAAGLREIERMMLLGKQQVTGLPADLIPSGVKVVSGGLFSQVLVFDNEIGIDALADQLVALVERDAALKFSADLCNVPVAASLSTLVSSSYTFLVPIEDLRAGCTLRLLKDELFHGEKSDASLKTAVIDFLRGDPTSSPVGWDAFGWFADAIEKRTPRAGTRLQAAVRSLPDLFNSQLELFLNQRYPFSLSGGKSFLTQLQSAMEKSCNQVSRMGEGGNSLVGQMNAFRTIINGLQGAIDHWEVVIGKLEKRLYESYDGLCKSLLSLSSASNTKTVYWRGLREPDPVEPAYDELRNQPKEVWQALTAELHNALHWQWTSPPGDQPYLRCLIHDIAYTEPETMFLPLFRHAYPLTGTLTKNANIYKSLGRLSAQEVVSAFEQSPLLAKRDPLPSPDRRTAQYLIGGEDPMISSWNLPTDISVCQSHSKHRLTYLRFEFNLPAAGLKAYTSGLEGYLNDSPFLHVYPHEQHARRMEKRLDSGQGHSMDDCIQAPLTALMSDPRFFDTAMWCVFLGWIKREVNERGTSCYQLNAADDLSFLLESNRFPANKLEDAIVNFVITFPSEDFEGLHPLSSMNLPGTLSKLESAIHYQRNRPYNERKQTYPEIERRINDWKSSRDPFLKGLAAYQGILLSDERKRRGKI